MNRRFQRLLLCALYAAFGLGGLLAGGSPAWAESSGDTGFGGLTGNDPGDTETGEDQLLVDVGNDIGGLLVDPLLQVRFTFINLGPEPCSITDIYFDDGSLLGIAFLENTEGLVEFSVGASPGELPGAEMAVPPFETTMGFSADSDAPAQPLGVNPGEQLGIVFDLMPGKTIPDVIDELTTGELRIGIHVQGFASGGSESFINIPIPEPGTALLLLAGLLPLARRRG